MDTAIHPQMQKNAGQILEIPPLPLTAALYRWKNHGMAFIRNRKFRRGQQAIGFSPIPNKILCLRTLLVSVKSPVQVANLVVVFRCHPDSNTYIGNNLSVFIGTSLNADTNQVF